MPQRVLESSGWPHCFQGEPDVAALVALVGDEIGHHAYLAALESPDARGAFARHPGPLLDAIGGILEGVGESAPVGPS
jgi:hypothetical protein